MKVSPHPIPLGRGGIGVCPESIPSGYGLKADAVVYTRSITPRLSVILTGSRFVFTGVINDRLYDSSVYLGGSTIIRQRRCDIRVVQNAANANERRPSRIYSIDDPH